MPYICSVTWTAKPGRENAVLGALLELASASRREPGTIYYQPYQDQAEPRVFRIFEVYQNEDAFNAHKASEHFKRLAEGKVMPELEPPIEGAAFFQTLPTVKERSLEEHDEPARRRGQRTYKQYFGHKRKMKGADDLARFTIDHLFANVWSRPGLCLRDRSMITVALLAAQGRDDELRSHLEGAANQGISAIQIEEIMIHVAHYAGWPAWPPRLGSRQNEGMPITCRSSLRVDRRH